MLDLTFGEQVKIILSRRGMTIKELAETIEACTGKKMSRQNLTQRLGRDNFQEQDMRMIAEILGCPFQLSILGDSIPTEKVHNTEENQETVVPEVDESVSAKVQEVPTTEETMHERDITIGELVDIHEELDAMMGQAVTEEEPQEIMPEETREENVMPADNKDIIEETSVEDKKEEPVKKVRGWRSYLLGRKKKQKKEEEETVQITPETSIPEEDVHVAEPVDDSEKAEWTESVNFRESAQEDYAQAENPIEEYEQAEYEQDDYYRTEYEQEGYQQAEYEQTEYSADEYGQEGDGQEEFEQESYEQISGNSDEEEDLVNGDVNPYTGREYQSNSVRMHPTRIGYVQVYDRSNHAWTDMTEWAFLGYQERKKVLLGKDYEPPIYLD